MQCYLRCLKQPHSRLMALEGDFDWLGGLRAAQLRVPALAEDEHVKAALAEVGSLVVACYAGTRQVEQLLYMFLVTITIVQRFVQGKSERAPCAVAYVICLVVALEPVSRRPLLKDRAS